MKLLSLLINENPSDDNNVTFRNPYLAGKVLSDNSESIKRGLRQQGVMNVLFKWLDRSTPLQAVNVSNVKNVFVKAFTSNLKDVCAKFSFNF